MTDIHAERRQRLAAIAADQGLGAIALVPGANLFYLSGLHFHLMERPTLLFVTAANRIVGIIPELEPTSGTRFSPMQKPFSGRTATAIRTPLPARPRH